MEIQKLSRYTFVPGAKNGLKNLAWGWRNGPQSGDTRDAAAQFDVLISVDSTRITDSL
jgi:hypothetical protein